MSTTVETALLPFQEDFVEQFLAQGSSSRQLLTGPLGAGLAQCTQVLASRLMASDADARVLVLVPRPLILQWFRGLGRFLNDSLLIEGSRRNFRELTADTIPSEFRWPSGRVVVMDDWLLRQSKELEISIFQTRWDLVVWDGLRIDGQTQRSDLLSRLSQSPNVLRLLVLHRGLRLSTSEDESLYESLGLSATVWDRALLRAFELSYVQRRLEYETIHYERTDVERELLAKVKDLEEILSKADPERERSMLSPVALMSGRRLQAAARSSRLALQETLYRVVPRKPRLLIRRGDLANLTESESEAAHDASRQVAELQELIDGIPVDSQLDAFLRFCKEAADQYRQIVVQCLFSATARYLYSAVSEISNSTTVITPELAPAEISARLSKFEEQGGIVVASATTLRGIEVSADLLIPYDMPPGRSSAFLGGRFVPKNAAKLLRVVTLEDSADTLATESQEADGEE